MKNIYYTSYFAFLSTILFTIAITLNLFQLMINLLSTAGILQPLSDILPEKEIRILTFLGIAFLVYALLSGLKLIADMVWQLSFLFFSKDEEGEDFITSKKNAYVFIVGGLIAVLLNHSLIYIGIMLVITCIAFVVLIFYKRKASFTLLGMIGFVIFQLVFWGLVVSLIIYAYFTLFAKFLTSLPF